MITDLEFRIMCAILSNTTNKYAKSVAPWAFDQNGLRLYVTSLSFYLKGDLEGGYTETEIKDCVEGLEEKGMLVMGYVKDCNYDDLGYRLTTFGMSILIAELAKEEEKEWGSTNTKKKKATIHIEHNTGNINIS